MVDLPWWIMGLMCMLVIGLCLLLLVLVVIRLGGKKRPLTDLEKDYDEGPRGRGER